MLDVFEAVNEGMEHPDSYWGAITDYQDNGWVLTFGRHRDSDLLEISNFETIEKQFEEKYEKNDDFRIEGSSHWAVGWTDQMMVRALQCNCEDWEKADITTHPDSRSKGLRLWRCHTCGLDFGIERVRQIFYDCLEIKNQLDDYPVLDEEDWSRREYEELMEYLEDEVSAIVRRYEGDTIEEDYEPDMGKVFSYLFETHSVSNVEDCEYAWIEDAVLEIADKEGKKL